MKHTYRSHNTAKPNTTYLQGMGHVEGIPAGELKAGMLMMWNNGAISRVESVVKESAACIWVNDEYVNPITNKTEIYLRKLKKSRIVATPIEA